MVLPNAEVAVSLHQVEMSEVPLPLALLTDHGTFQGRTSNQSQNPSQPEVQSAMTNLTLRTGKWPCETYMPSLICDIHHEQGKTRSDLNVTALLQYIYAFQEMPH